MQPTINSFDGILLERISVLLGTITRGDVVIAKFIFPSQPNICVCKRIRALAGDRVIVPSSTSYANIARVRVIPNIARVVVIPPDHVWLEGDNSVDSMDSRQYGPVPLAHVTGRVFYKVRNFHVQLFFLEHP